MGCASAGGGQSSCHYAAEQPPKRVAWRSRPKPTNMCNFRTLARKRQLARALLQEALSVASIEATLRDFSFKFGSGPTAILLVHGLTGTPAEMRGLGRGLAAAGHTAYGLQLTGHCGAEGDLVQTRWRDWDRDVGDAVAHLARRHRRVVVGGLCMGALLALRAAASRPREVAGVMLYSTTLFHDGWTIPRSRWLLPAAMALGLWRFWRFEEKLPYGIKDDRTRERLVSAMKAGDSAAAGNAATPGAAIRELHRLIRQVRADVPKVTCPSLVIHAAEDDIASRRNADWLASRLPGDVTKVILADSYHMVTLDREKDRVIAESIGFVARLPQAADYRGLRLVYGGEGA